MVFAKKWQDFTKDFLWSATLFNVNLDTKEIYLLVESLESIEMLTTQLSVL